MQDQKAGARVVSNEDTVRRLTSEIAALKLELATLHSALREIQQQSGRGPIKSLAIDPPLRPHAAPAAIVVLIAASLLTWQVITSPHVERRNSPADAARPVVASQSNTSARGLDQHAQTSPIALDTMAATEPPVTPLVKPTIYKGTLTVRADHPGARVYVNRRNVGVAPVRVKNLRAGAHLVWVESEGYHRWTRVVTVPAEQVTRVSADLEPITENP